MKLYLSIILVALIVLNIFDSLVATMIFETGALTFVSAISVSFTFVVVINIASAFFIAILPKKWFGINSKVWNVPNYERKFYENIKIRKWKDNVWELGWLGGFSKSKIKDPRNPEYVEKFIIESNKGVLDHVLRTIVGFFNILLFPQYVWVVGFPIALVNMVLNLMSTMVLRYNLPKLKIMHTRLSRAKENADDTTAN